MRNADPSPRPEYEPEDAQPRVIAATAAALAGIVGLGILAAVLVLGLEARRRDAAPSGPESVFQHGAAEKTSIEESWSETERDVKEHLSGYAWIDRRAGIVRIPVDRAIDLICSEQASKTGGAATRPIKP